MPSYPIDKTHPLWANMTEDEGLKGEARSYGMLYRERPPGPEHRFAAEGVTMTALDLLPGLAAGKPRPIDLATDGRVLLGAAGLLICHPAAYNDLAATIRGWWVPEGFSRFPTPDEHRAQPGVRAWIDQRVVLMVDSLPLRTMLDVPAGSVRYWASEVSIESREKGIEVRSKLALASDTPLTLLATGGA